LMTISTFYGTYREHQFVFQATPHLHRSLIALQLDQVHPSVSTKRRSFVRMTIEMPRNRKEALISEFNIEGSRYKINMILGCILAISIPGQDSGPFSKDVHGSLIMVLSFRVLVPDNGWWSQAITDRDSRTIRGYCSRMCTDPRSLR